MRKIASLLFALALLTLTSTANAGGQIQVRPGFVSAEVYNELNLSLVCSGKVYGTTASGHTLWATVTNMVVPPGQYRYYYVYTTPQNPFVSGWSDITCVVP